MYVVLEEINNGIARLVPDSKQEALYLSIKKIPEPYEVGDVFFVENNHRSGIFLKKDAEEKKRRLLSNADKRQKLINKSHNNKPVQ